MNVKKLISKANTNKNYNVIFISLLCLSIFSNFGVFFIMIFSNIHSKVLNIGENNLLEQNYSKSDVYKFQCSANSDILYLNKTVQYISPNSTVTWYSDVELICGIDKISSNLYFTFILSNIVSSIFVNNYGDLFGRRKLYFFLNIVSFFSLLSVIYVKFLFQIYTAIFLNGISSLNIYVISVYVNEHFDYKESGIFYSIIKIALMTSWIFVYFVFSYFNNYHLLITAFLLTQLTVILLSYFYIFESYHWLLGNKQFATFREVILLISKIDGSEDEIKPFYQECYFNFNQNQRRKSSSFKEKSNYNNVFSLNNKDKNHYSRNKIFRIKEENHYKEKNKFYEDENIFTPSAQNENDNTDQNHVKNKKNETNLNANRSENNISEVLQYENELLNGNPNANSIANDENDIFKIYYLDRELETCLIKNEEDNQFQNLNYKKDANKKDNMYYSLNKKIEELNVNYYSFESDLDSYNQLIKNDCKIYESNVNEINFELRNRKYYFSSFFIFHSLRNLTIKMIILWFTSFITNNFILINFFFIKKYDLMVFFTLKYLSYILYTNVAIYYTRKGIMFYSTIISAIFYFLILINNDKNVEVVCISLLLIFSTTFEISLEVFTVGAFPTNIRILALNLLIVLSHLIYILILYFIINNSSSNIFHQSYELHFTFNIWINFILSILSGFLILTILELDKNCVNDEIPEISMLY